MTLAGMTIEMKPEEAISVGKYWLWMTVFFTCFFVSCGEANRQPQAPLPPTQQTQAVPVPHEEEQFRDEVVEADPIVDSHQVEEIPSSDFDDSDLERFDNEDTHQQVYEEVYEPEPEDEAREIQPVQNFHEEAHEEARTDVARRDSDDSALDEEPSLVDSPSTEPKTPPSTEDPDPAWEAQFQASDDTDSFEPDSADEFANLD